ncbi:MAG: sugar ABC transporter substrate-binding protein [Solirubrobacteraceae bacterium]
MKRGVRGRSLWALVLVLALAAFGAACGTSDNNGGGDNATQGDAVDLTQGGDVKVAMVTHGDGGSFWAVAKKGAEDAAKQEGVELKYSESNNDAQAQAQMIEAAVTEKVDGLAVSAPDPDAISGAVQKAVDAGITVITLNSGAESFQDLGAITHVGQTETIAGEGAGAQFKQAGSKKLLCVIHEQANLGLNQRCDGAKKGFGGEVETLQVKGTADVATSLTEMQSKLQSDKSIDAVLALNPDIAVAARDAVKGAGSDAKVGTFDLSGDVVKAIKAGEIVFAVDQQQYLQGYLPVVFLALNKRNANTVGGGAPVLTGPGFVTQENAETVEKLAEAGTR